MSEQGLQGFHAELAQLRTAHAGDGARLALLDQIDAWARAIETTLQ
jgi:exodeoxyribonuclease-1